MPNAVVQSFAAKTNKSVEEVEKLWKSAVEIAKKEYPNVKESDNNFYAIVTGILKKSLGIKEGEKMKVSLPKMKKEIEEEDGAGSGPVITTSSIGGKDAQYAKKLGDNSIWTRLGKAYKKKKKSDGTTLEQLEQVMEDRI
jgi:hypothetical protein